MTCLRLYTSERITSEDAELIHTALRRSADVEAPQLIVRKADIGTIPQIIQIVGDLAAWLPLASAATVYLNTIAKHLADATWNSMSSKTKIAPNDPIEEITAALAHASKSHAIAPKIVLSLSFSGHHSKASLVLPNSDTLEMARNISRFIVHMEHINELMEIKINSEKDQFGDAIIELHADGSVILSWRTEDWKKHEKRFL